MFYRTFTFTVQVLPVYAVLQLNTFDVLLICIVEDVRLYFNIILATCDLGEVVSAIYLFFTYRIRFGVSFLRSESVLSWHEMNSGN